MYKRIAIWLAIVGVALVVVGFTVRGSGVQAIGATGGFDCGTVNQYQDATYQASVRVRLSAGLGLDNNLGARNIAACDAAIESRGTLSWILFGLGAAVLLGAGLTGFSKPYNYSTSGSTA